MKHAQRVHHVKITRKPQRVPPFESREARLKFLLFACSSHATVTCVCVKFRNTPKKKSNSRPATRKNKEKDVIKSKKKETLAQKDQIQQAMKQNSARLGKTSSSVLEGRVEPTRLEIGLVSHRIASNFLISRWRSM
jgi:hypothetical protein